MSMFFNVRPDDWNGLSALEKLNTLRSRILKIAAEVTTYKNWDADFSVRMIREFAEGIADDKFSKINSWELAKIPFKTLVDLGFNLWSTPKNGEDTALMLFPLWVLPILEPEMAVESISGDVVLLKDADTDNRFGCLAYGIHIDYVMPVMPVAEPGADFAV